MLVVAGLPRRPKTLRLQCGPRISQATPMGSPSLGGEVRGEGERKFGFH
jgi:hypothetical protein